MCHSLQRGFSLIELTIVIALFGILAAMAMPTFSTFIANARIRTAAEGMLNGLQIARAEAVRRNTYVNFQIGADNISWNVVAADGTILQTRGAEPGALVTPTVRPAGTTSATFSGMGRMVKLVDSGATQVDPPAQPNAFAIRYTSATNGSRPMCVVVIANTPRLCDPGRDQFDPQGCYFPGSATKIADCL